MRRLFSLILFWLSLAIAPIAIALMARWAGDEAFQEWVEESYALTKYTFFMQFFFVAGAQAAILFLGYVLSLDPRARCRPWISMIAGAMGPGATAGLAAYGHVNYQVDGAAWGAMIGGAIAATAILLGFEYLNRWLWQFIVAKLDQRNMGSAALVVSRLALLWRPGQDKLLLSVGMERFRRGARGEVCEQLRKAYEEGRREPDLLELLCQLAAEEKKPDEYLTYLNDLFTQFPEDEALQAAYLSELLEQGKKSEALRHMEKHGVADNEEALEKYAGLLLEAGRLEKAVDVTRRIGELEGIPMRRAEALLRRVLSEKEDHLDAINLLADWAERMGRKDQLIRWLARSVQIDGRQRERSMHLVKLYEEIGVNDRLEELLEQLVQDRPADYELALRYARVLRENGKVPEALEFLEQLEARGCKARGLFELLANSQFDLKDHQTAQETVQRGFEALKEEDRAGLVSLQRKIERALLSNELSELIDKAKANPKDLELQLQVLERLATGPHGDRTVAHADTVLLNHPDARADVIETIQKAIEASGEGGYALINYLADLQVADGHYDEALETIKLMAERSLKPEQAIQEGAQKILRRSPHHLNTLRTMGEFYQDLGKFTEMIHSYSLYLANGGEENEEIDRSLVNAYMSLNDYHSARRFVNSLLKAATDSGDDEDDRHEANKEMLFRVIPMAIDAGEAVEAAEYMKKLEIMDPANRQARKLRSTVDEALGKQRFAFLKQEIESGKGSGKALEELGDLCASQNDYNQAITYYQRAARQKTTNRIPRVKLAHAFAKKRMFDLAGETLAEISLSIDDSPEDLEELMDWLYRTAEVLEEAHMFERANRLFKQLMKIDAGYRDVLQKVERLSKR